MSIRRPDRSLTRAPRPALPSVPAKPSPRDLTLPAQIHELIVRAPAPPADPDAQSADERLAMLTAEQLLTELRAQRARATKAFYAMGLLLRELARPERYRVELGFETFEDLLEQKYMTNKMTALRYITVVTIFTEIMATELGVEKSYALARYAAAMGNAESAPTLYRDNVLIGKERVRDMSIGDLLRAARDFNKPTTPGPPTDMEQEARRAARAMQAALRRAGAKSAEARAQRDKGEWQVTVQLSTAHAASWALGK